MAGRKGTNRDSERIQMKLTFNSVRVDDVRQRNGKKNTGGCYSVMKLTCMMTKSVRNALGIGDLEQWPPDHIQKSGKLKGSFDTVNLILTAEQEQLSLDVAKLNEADIQVSLVDSFRWAMEDPDDEENRTVLLTFSARTADVTAAQLMVAYKFSVSAGNSKVVMNYNKPGDGQAVNMIPTDPNQLHIVTEEQRATVEEIPEGEGGKAPTHADKVRERKAESERKAAARKGTTVVN